jgi:acetyl-CoA synthetase
VTDTVWRPGPEVIERANVTRLARRLGADGYDDLLQRSVADLETFWATVVEDLDLPFLSPFERVLDESDGPEWARWFVGGELNLAQACATRFADDEAHRDTTAIIWEGEAGETRELTYAELAHEVRRAAEGLASLGIGREDAVGLLLPMTPEVVIALYACCAVGALAIPIFSGFSAPAVAARLQDAGAVALMTCDAFPRRERPVVAKRTADEAAAASPTVRHVVVVRRLGAEIPWTEGRDHWWHELLDAQPGKLDPVPVSSEHPFMLAYTSGTTGRPKGAVHVHGGFLVKIASEVAYLADHRPGDRLHWVTDMGWIMGPWVTVGTHALGGCVMLYDGAPDHPDAARLWRLVERHGLTFLGVSPTLVRALEQHGETPLGGIDLSSLRLFGSTGEPWNPEPYLWLFDTVGGGTRPIVNISGGTEVAACFLGSCPVLPVKPGSLGRPLPGMAMEVYDPQGQPVRGEVGELVCRRPWPSMTRGIWGDRERYLESYWRRFPGVWTHGDWASVDDDGEWFLHGRSDDTLNVAGKRIGPAEYESALVDDPSVAEACAVGVPDEVKGEAVVCFVVLTRGAEPSDELRTILRERVATALGRPFAPRDIRFTEALPKTRSAKIVRRAVRAVTMGEDPGDVSTLEDPEALEAVAQAE